MNNILVRSILDRMFTSVRRKLVVGIRSCFCECGKENVRVGRTHHRRYRRHSPGHIMQACAEFEGGHAANWEDSKVVVVFLAMNKRFRVSSIELLLLFEVSLRRVHMVEHNFDAPGGI